MAVPTYLVSDLVAQVRTESDLNRSQVFTDSQIATLLSDGGADLQDIFTGSKQHRNISTFDFTLVGGVGQNSVTLPDDFQEGNSVDVNPNSGQTYTLRYLSNWLDRNQLNSAPFAVGGPGGGPRCYFILGSSPATLVVLPANSAAGNFRLYYTPMWTPLALPVAVTDLTPGIDGAITVTSGTDHINSPSDYIFTAYPHGGFAGQSIQTSGWANATNNGIKLVTAFNSVTRDATVSATNLVSETAPVGVTANLLLFNQSGGVWSMNGLAAAAPTVGSTLIVSGAANPGNNGSFPILSVPSPTSVTTAATGLVNETFGPNVTVQIQPAGTRSTLPNFMNPWVLYFKTMASITIRNKRGQDVSAFEQRLAVQKQRIEVILQSRVEDPQQPPMTRNGGNWGGWGSGWGGW